MEMIEIFFSNKAVKKWIEGLSNQLNYLKVSNSLIFKKYWFKFYNKNKRYNNTYYKDLKNAQVYNLPFVEAWSLASNFVINKEILFSKDNVEITLKINNGKIFYNDQYVAHYHYDDNACCRKYNCPSDIIVATTPSMDRKYTIIDGNHCVSRLINEGKTEVKSTLISEDTLINSCVTNYDKILLCIHLSFWESIRTKDCSIAVEKYTNYLETKIIKK